MTNAILMQNFNCLNNLLKYFFDDGLLDETFFLILYS